MLVNAAATETLAILAEAKRVLTVEQQAIAQLANRLDETFVEAIHLLEQTQGRVIVTGMGKSGHIAQKIAATMASTGTPAYFLHPAEGRHGDLGMVTPADVVVALSNSGETEELLGLLPTLQALGVKVIALTAKVQSTLGTHSAVVLNTQVSEEACPLGLAPTASTTLCLALGDALALVLQHRKQFTPAQFALFHPAGNLGKRLLLKVADLMHQGAEQLPFISAETPFLQALISISQKQLGLGLVVNAHHQLLGVLTDGDIRRGLERFGQAIHTKTVADLMTQHPKTITSETLAVEALRLLESYRITALAVVEAETKTALPVVVGVLHLHDLLNSGL
jgi:arabinose-5-phosphate isomerase